MVSELDYLLLEHVVFSDDWDFCLWEMLQQGGSWILGYFDIDWNQGSTNNEISSGVNIFMRWVFNFCPFGIFCSHVIRVLNVES